MAHPLLLIQGKLSRSDPSQHNENYCYVYNVSVKIDLKIQYIDDSYTLSWKRALEDPTEPNLDYLKKNVPALLPEKWKKSKLNRTQVIKRLKLLLGEFENLEVGLVGPHREHLMSYPSDKEYYVYNSTCSENEEDRQALHQYIDRLKEPLNLIRKVVLA